MAPAELEKMARLEDQYWWFVGRRFIVSSLIQKFWKPKSQPAVILDLGCGTGGSFPLLKKFGEVVGLDASLVALNFSRKRGMKQIILGDAQFLPFADNKFDLIAVLDVLEHLDDDFQALREIWRVLKPEGAVVFSVPAFMSLWSVHDIALTHKRRYLWSEIHNKIVKAGFEIKQLSYAICPLLPIVFVFRKVQNFLMKNKEPATALIELPELINNALISLLKFEAALLPFVRLPFGVSIVGLAQKKQGLAEGK
ncbi:MAG: class I SAM-dependent methyltransferase [Armatimonadetes bacterium]|nr:class I SAM-dependent methyltransferase [Armatimonadota bacterium]MDW8027586.1 class I SAM-dependent methyltransferase [Armatimonadota bacterium]